MRVNEPVTNNEVTFSDDDLLISKTDEPLAKLFKPIDLSLA